jgi:hypothetical protein
MISGGVRIDGLNRVVRDLPGLGLDISDLKDAFSDIAAEGARLASSFAPKRTGTLAASVRGNRAKNKAVVAAGKARVPWAGPINYGWRARGIAPSRFMQKADEAMQPRALAELENAIEKKIREKGLN